MSTQTLSRPLSDIKKMSRPELEKLAARKIMMARAAIIQSRPFYGVLVANVKAVPCWSIPTMGTDSRTHYYNPAFIAGLTQAEVEGVQIHESEHDARHHSTRRAGRKPVQWNKAADYTINGDIIAQGAKLPEGVLYRDDLIGMAAEDIYRILEAEDRQKEQDKPQPEDGDGEADDEGNADTDDTESDDDASDDGKSQDGDDESEADDESEGDGDAGSDDESEDNDEADTDGGKGDGDEADDDADGDGGDGEAEGDDAEGGDADGDGDDGESGGSGAGAPTSAGEGAGFGEVFDAPGDAAEKADLDAKWTVIAHQAAAIAAKGDDVPGHWKNIFDKRKTVTQNWRDVLRDFFDAGASVIQTWSRPNRRFAHSGLFLPGNQRDGLNKVVFLVDTSGSMVWMEGVMNKVANEVQAAIEANVISEAIVVYGDTVVTRVDRYVNGETIEFDPLGGGCTDMRPLFDWVEQNEPDATAIVCLTDLEIGDVGIEPTKPVLWAAYNDPRKIVALTPPWGRVIDVGFGV